MKKEKKAPYMSWYSQAYEMYNQGFNDTKISDSCNVSRNAVAYWRNKNNLPTQPRIVKKKEFSWHNIADAMYKKGAHDSEIAKRCNTHISNVRRWRYRNNYESNGTWTTHGAVKRHKKLALIWRSILFRCENIKSSSYARYGGRGITVCDEWKDNPNTFIDWALSNGYQEGLQIDRIDNNKGYSPDNCRWVTPQENSLNRRVVKMITVNGTSKCASHWAEQIGVCSNTVLSWVRKYGEKEASSMIKERLKCQE